eukprot:2371992-Heterocapsa_arctica.AAC.1
MGPGSKEGDRLQSIGGCRQGCSGVKSLPWFASGCRADGSGEGSNPRSPLGLAPEAISKLRRGEIGGEDSAALVEVPAGEPMGGLEAFDSPHEAFDSPQPQPD